MLLALGATPLPARAEPAPQPLPQLGAKLEETSVSGISSGAYMAGQFQLAHGKIVVGAAIIAGGPYGCAESPYGAFAPGFESHYNAMRAINGCMQHTLAFSGVPNPRQLARRAEGLAQAKRIDSLDHVKTDRVYVFGGRNDTVVRPAIVKAAVAFYRALGVPENNIVYVADSEAGHAFVTETEGGSCALSQAPYVVDCDYDQAGALLAHIYGTLAPATATPSGQFILFDQKAFATGLFGASLSDAGVAYVPAVCERTAGCRIHIAFHGCAQNRDTVQDQFVQGTGFARWADTNRLIVLFPQAARRFNNPQGCWDWWGYSGSNFLTRDAPQIEAVFRMIARLSEPRTGAGPVD